MAHPDAFVVGVILFLPLTLLRLTFDTPQAHSLSVQHAGLLVLLHQIPNARVACGYSHSLYFCSSELLQGNVMRSLPRVSDRTPYKYPSDSIFPLRWSSPERAFVLAVTLLADPPSIRLPVLPPISPVISWVSFQACPFSFPFPWRCTSRWDVRRKEGAY